MTATEYSLSDRMAATEGMVAMSGIQALMRLLLDQARADRAKGLNTGGLISGYRGSPVGGMDQAYDADREILMAHGIRFISGVNEDLGATAVWGSQQIAMEENANVDGVLGMWYGKGPGVDRSGDAIRHANSSGVHPNGGVLAVAGDDPFCKSSTIASASEWALADMALPTLYPASVQEVLDYGRYGYELSRFSGAWVGFKIHSNVADAYMTVRTDADRLSVITPDFEIDGKPFKHVQTATLIAPFSMSTEQDMFGPRLEAAKRFVAANGLDRIIGAADAPATVGIVAAGPVYGELRDALATMGLKSDDDLAAAGIRLYKPAMIWPLEPDGLTRFADGLQEIIVIEEKRSFIEAQIRDLLYGRTDAPRVLGKHDDEGRPMLKHYGGLLAEDLDSPLRDRLGRVLPADTLQKPRQLIPVAITSEANKLPNRSAYFCSGCPHNRSTVLPDGSMSGGGIGCHGMALGMGRENFGITHMGGEGVQWVGMAPFLDEEHRFQNLGDGTYAHSGSLAIRQAVSAGTNVTYKILYNGTVAMTGGQDAAGAQTVPDLTLSLAAEGVARVVVVADDVDKYPDNAVFAKGCRVEHRDKLDDVQRELRDVPGVTVLIYDQQCAAELRRGRKRGTIETPTTRIMINEDICEGCGDCGDVSNCASVHPVATPFGRKTQIHQESCNFDLTCLGGNCPAFVTVEIDPDYTPTKAALAGVPDGEVPTSPAIPDNANVLLVGIGGTGVVTVNQILATAAMLDGKYSSALDQTGLAQKGGPVVSNLRITVDEQDDLITGSNRIGDGAADALLAFDLLTATKNINRAAPDRTTAVVSTALVPTGAMVSGRGAEFFPELAKFQSAIDGATKAANNTWLDAAGIGRRVFASQPAANVLVVGLAFQKGLLPVTADSIEQAIQLNGVAIDTNLEAFRLGRRLAVEPGLLDALDDSADTTTGPAAPELTGASAKMADAIGGGETLREVLAWRLPELIAYQSKAYAQQYTDDLVAVRQAEAAVGNRTDFSETVARMLYKVMAYKDEYEVARLALKSDLTDRAKQRFGPNASVSYQLKPPTLKAAGYDRKIGIPETAGKAMFQGLLRTKRLRGTRLDPFGRTDERRTERELIDEYRELVTTLSSKLTAENYDQAVEIAGLYDMVRGYDTVKLANVDKYRVALAKALADF
ncbi:MAG: indolepyruvate ferredoxin oxidoreductase family protein [Actinomycetota bacterium]